MRRAVAYLGDKLPKGYPDAFRQVGLFVLADICYETVRGIAEGQRAVAFANGRELIDFERATGTFFEPGFQAWQIGERWLIDLANFMYMNTHFVLTTGFLVWLYIQRNDSFYFVRNMFMVAMGLALVGYALYPTAPPRLFTEFGFVDTITDFSNVNHDSALVKVFVNPYAAVPSMHIAFALMISIPGVMLSRHLWSKAFWSVYPLIVFWVVVVTANHYWADAAIGALVAAVAALVAHRLLARARPEAWAWRTAPSHARA
ncbi:MAG: phosphatase PAP2 family protein [Actinomycetota bacterium]